MSDLSSNNSDDKVEFLTDPNNNRPNIFPILHEDIWEYYQKFAGSFWIENEISLAEDLKDWKKLNSNEKHYMLMVNSFFANSDFIVLENLKDNIGVMIPELNMAYNFQKMMEDIHSQFYARCIQAFSDTKEHALELFNATKNIPTIKKKAEWARKWIKDGSFVERLIAFSVVEGVFFSSSFASIFWMRTRGLFPGLGSGNEFVARDESLHRDLACLLYRKYVVNKLPGERLLQIIKEGVDIEKEFVNDALPVSLIGMNSKEMCEYVEYVADHLLDNLIGKKMYNTKNPFLWCILSALDKKVDFFVHRPTQYSIPSATSKDTSDSVIKFDADF